MTSARCQRPPEQGPTGRAVRSRGGVRIIPQPVRARDSARPPLLSRLLGLCHKDSVGLMQQSCLGRSSDRSRSSARRRPPGTVAPPRSRREQGFHSVAMPAIVRQSVAAEVSGCTGRVASGNWKTVRGRCRADTSRSRHFPIRRGKPTLPIRLLVVAENQHDRPFRSCGGH